MGFSVALQWLIFPSEIGSPALNSILNSGPKTYPKTFSAAPHPQAFTIQQNTMPPDPSNSCSPHEHTTSGKATAKQSMLSVETSSSADVSESSAPPLGPLESDNDMPVKEEKFAHRIQPFPEPCLILCHWVLYLWVTVTTLGCLGNAGVLMG